MPAVWPNGSERPTLRPRLLRRHKSRLGEQRVHQARAQRRAAGFNDRCLYEVTGPRLRNFAEAAAEISAAFGTKVKSNVVSADGFRSSMTVAMRPEMASMLTDLRREVLDGRSAVLGDAVQQALGRESRDFDRFCRVSAASGLWSGCA